MNEARRDRTGARDAARRGAAARSLTRDEAAGRVGERVLGSGPLDSTTLIGLQQAFGNGAVSGLLAQRQVAEGLPELMDPGSEPVSEGLPELMDPGSEPVAEELTAGSSEADEEGGDTDRVRLFDAVGLQIYVLGPLRRVQARVDSQDWQEAVDDLLPVGNALLEFYYHYSRTNEVVAERLLTYKNYLGMIYTHLRYRLSERGASDQELSSMMASVVSDLDEVSMPER